MTLRMASYNVAEAKRHFSELIDRVSDGERILIARRGTPVMALVPPDEVSSARPSRPVGLAAAAGALSDWQGLDDMVSEIYAARDQAADRAAPHLD